MDRIRVGEWDVNNDSEFYTHVEFDVIDIFIHDEYYPGNLFNDIALIRVNGYVDYARNPHISPGNNLKKFNYKK
jgi:secreted trypsin-like serine protease